MSGVSPEPLALEMALACYVAAMPEGGSVGLGELAARFGCSPKEVKHALQVVLEVEDRDLVTISGAVIDEDDGRLVKYLSGGYEKDLQRPVRLSPAQARAALLALDLVSGDVGSDALRELKSKMRAAAGGEVSDVEVGKSFDEEIPVTDAIERARKENRVLEIRYLARRRAQTRSVEPLEVSTVDGFEYLTAYCRSTGIVRPFQLGRILSARLTERRFTERRDGTTPREEPPTRAVVRFSPGASPSPEEGADSDLVEEHPDGSTDYAVYYTDTGQAARRVMRYLGKAVVLEPEELKREVHCRAESLLLRYRNRR